ncbi:hypothetical protein ACFZB6_29440 [Streptomyces syringium]
MFGARSGIIEQFSNTYLLRGRVYGRDHDDDPNPGPLPHRTYAVLK